jgi:hypothetical protein
MVDSFMKVCLVHQNRAITLTVLTNWVTRTGGTPSEEDVLVSGLWKFGKDNTGILEPVDKHYNPGRSAANHVGSKLLCDSNCFIC